MQAPLPLSTNCLRCGRECRSGTPDPTKQAIVVSAGSGYCANCVITIFLHRIEPIRDIIKGTPRKEGRGPEIFLDGPWRDSVLRPVMVGVLAHTQLPEDAIDWIEVVGNWFLPLPPEALQPL